MSNEFEDIGSRLPDLNSVLMQRIASKNADVNGNSLPPPGTCDPYKLMVKRKREMEVSDIDPGTIVRWPAEDIKALQDYCTKMGIFGYNTKLHPKIALAQLKKQLGDFDGIPLENRLVDGYEKMGTKSQYGPNYPYSSKFNQKTIITDSNR